MAIRWDSESDWKDNQDSSGTTVRNGNLRQGYRREKPPLTDGLVGWWPLHDDSATDYSGNGNHGTPSGGPTFGVAGKGGLQAASFDGKDDYIDVSYTASGSTTRTLWVYPETENVLQGLISNTGTNGGDLHFHILDSGTQFQGHLYTNSSGGYVDVYAPLDLNKWQHLAFVYDSASGDVRIYKNGSLVDSVTATSGLDVVPASFIGNEYDSTRQLNGNIFDARVYNRALSASEIQTLYEWGLMDLARPPTDGVARYALDGDATDSWGANDGTNNGVTFVSDSIRGQSGDFDGTDDYINPSTNFGLSSTSDFSMSLWAKTSDTSDSRIIGLYNGSDDIFYFGIAGTGNGNLSFRIGHAGGSEINQNAFGPIVANGSWYHYTIVWESSTSTAKIYVNGSLIKSFSSTVSDPFDDSETMDFGRRSDGTDYYNGHVDNVRIYDYALSPSEAFELYQWGTKGRDMRKFLVTQ